MSERIAPRDAEFVSVADPTETFEITIVLRARPDGAPRDFYSLSAVGHRLSPAEFERQHGAHPDDVTAMGDWLADHKLDLTSVHVAAKQLKVHGSVENFNAAFSVDLGIYHKGEHTFRHHATPIQLPPQIRPYVVAVVGLDNQPVHAARHSVIRSGIFPDASDPPNTGALRVQDVCTLYNFPTNTAAGQTIAIVEFSNSVVNPTDITSYFSSTFTTRPQPTVTTIMTPATDPNNDPGEANLDVCVAGSAAPGCAIAMYYVPELNGSTTTTQDIINTYTRIVHPQGGDPTCHVCTTSWGLGDGNNEGYLTTTLQDAAAQGVTMCFSSGDSGSAASGNTDGLPHVENGDPWMLICGGTVIGAIAGTTFSEWLWNTPTTGSGGGGGVSTFYTVPTYQSNNGVNPIAIPGGVAGRGVPDISGNASPDSGYVIWLNGVEEQFGGTSATSPLIAGLIAVINAVNGKTSGFINTLIYATQAVARDISPATTVGGQQNNSVNVSGVGTVTGYPILAGWDACTGLGVLNGTYLKSLIASGTITPNFPNTVMTYSGGPILDRAEISYVFWGSVWNTQSPSPANITAAMTTHYGGSYWEGMAEYFIFNNPSIVNSLVYTGTTPPSFGTLTDAQAQTVVQNLLTSLFTTSTLPPATDASIYMVVLPLTAGAVAGELGGHGNFLFEGCPIVYAYVFGSAPTSQLTTLNQYTGALTAKTTEAMTDPWGTSWNGPGPGSTSTSIVSIENEDIANPGLLDNGVWTYGFYSNVVRNIVIPTPAAQGGGGGVAMLNPLDKSSTIQLTNGNLTATSNGPGPQSVRANLAIAPGAKAYFEVTINATTPNLAIGLSTDTFNLAEPKGLGTDFAFLIPSIGGSQQSVGYYPTSSYRPGRILLNDGSSYLVSTGATNGVNGNVIGVAIDWVTTTDGFFGPEAPLYIYFTSTGMQADGNKWNNSFTANPVQAIGGLDHAAFAGNVIPTFNTQDSGSSVTFNFGATPFVFPVPAGFFALNTEGTPYTAPVTTIGPPVNVNAGIATAANIPITWSPPTTGTGPFSYNVQYLTPSISAYYPWVTVGTTTTTSINAAFPAGIGPADTVFLYRVQAVNASGAGQWSTAVPFSYYPVVHDPGSQVAQPSYPWQVSSTPTTATFLLQPETNTEALTQQYYSAPFTDAGGFPTWTAISGAVTSPSSPISSFTVTGLQPSTQYSIGIGSTASGIGKIETLIGTQLYAITTPGTGASIVYSTLIPSGCQAIVAPAQQVSPFLTSGTTAHFALYYDFYENFPGLGQTLASSVLSSCEAIYTQYVSWFGGQPPHSPAFQTSINPTGSLLNVYIGPNSNVANACMAGDIFLSYYQLGVGQGTAPGVQFQLSTELAFLFMNRMQSMADCNITAVSYGLAEALSYITTPTGYGLRTDYATEYMNSPSRMDFVNSLVSTIGYPNFPEGCASLFFAYLQTQLGFTFSQIIATLNTTATSMSLRQIYNLLANNATDPFPDFIGRLNRHFPAGTNVSNFTPNPFPLA